MGDLVVFSPYLQSAGTEEETEEETCETLKQTQSSDETLCIPGFELGGLISEHSPC